MAILEQLEILKQGPSVWNAWRRENKVKIDLSDITLHDTRAPWRKEELTEIDLEGVNFRSANLENTTLRGANLQRADLSNANLRYSTLRRANLSGTILRGTNLTGANLTLASLRDANLTNALMWETILARTDLRDVTGLEHVKHGGPSVIDHRTFRRSSKFPYEFLRGIGLPDNIIKQYTTTKTEEYEDCFISYSSADEEFVTRFYNDLQAAGVRCWFAPEDLGLGAKIRTTLHDAIESTSRFIVVLSENSIRSEWVEDEVERALEIERKINTVLLLPIRIDDSVMSCGAGWASSLQRIRNIADFTRWPEPAHYNKSMERVLNELSISKIMA
ncbi:MAG: toll/interleukin-1 receptor domain-containing protein [Candidatus Thiodiazotropha sp.]|nr:toll/interleukin-1 receptor domain-containing protein [Chromatiales bacterium]